MEDADVQKVTASAADKVSAIFAHNMSLYMKENSISGNALSPAVAYRRKRYG